MKLNILVDNNTYIDRYLLAEPGLCILLETGENKILFDTGFSDAFLKNANARGHDLLDLDQIVLSHSHLDHTWGLPHLFSRYVQTGLEGRKWKRPGLVAHPLLFKSRYVEGVPELGSLVSQERAAAFCDLKLSTEPIWLESNLVFLGEIPRTFGFENQYAIGRIRGKEEDQDCYVQDDSALAWKTPEGLVIITGCSHAGICNIIEHAQKVCQEEKILDIIGGLHLLDAPPEQMRGTLEYLKKIKPVRMHPCHCTDLKAKIALAQVVDLEEVGVGLCLEY
ncbi:MBL fold metallo-hydrolase [Dethiosulfatarculus sandiegensis]|uniref:Beta-lactamase n=1 Tax=Dethiosulfatarculus sandiegensis TaxID=1429043 RepID=A0A0D2JYQ1_9BACT|nr:MBL fold metallo-hydrolase [Dethiosulfatarculus sandiegensis]KIX14690.1 beta-lactamase [Dethiosulfatarculus sandiegensis]